MVVFRPWLHKGRVVRSVKSFIEKSLLGDGAPMTADESTFPEIRIEQVADLNASKQRVHVFGCELFMILRSISDESCRSQEGEASSAAAAALCACDF